jgi:hypothetical protein
VAAFPLPPLDLFVSDPLLQLFHSCETQCVAGCCSLDAFDVCGEQLAAWVAGQSAAHAVAALNQFEWLLDTISGHRGPVVADSLDGHFNHTWQTPYDCLTYFAEWRQAIAEALTTLAESPFFSPNWLTEPVAGLRDAILAERAFDRLPVLADALEEAGCDNRLVLDHLRTGEDHAHMCWVMDVLSVGGGQRH